MASTRRKRSSSARFERVSAVKQIGAARQASLPFLLAGWFAEFKLANDRRRETQKEVEEGKIKGVTLTYG